jgi:predicted PurR-regulated permease PerM
MNEGIKMNSTIVVIIFVVALILSVGFLMLVLTLVPAINQLKSLLKDLEKTSAEARDLALKLKSVSGKVEKDIEKFDLVLDYTKETMGTVKESLKFINRSVLKQTAGVFGLVSAIRVGWNLIKKFKRR